MGLYLVLVRFGTIGVLFWILSPRNNSAEDAGPSPGSGILCKYLVHIVTLEDDPKVLVAQVRLR